jgi:hypothetical protein
MIPHRLTSAGCLLALALTGCASDAPPPNLIPPARAEATVDQLSGDYCYFGPDFNLRSFRRSPSLIPFFNVEALGEPTKVSVEATAEQVCFTYTNRDGVEVKEVFSPATSRARWKDGALVVPWKEVRPNVGVMIGANVAGNVLGLVLAGLLHSDSYSPHLYLGGRNRESRLFRLSDGRLVMSDTFRASGDLKEADMASGSWERQDSVALLLDPAVGDCRDGPTRPPEAWFDEGVDLRVPVCADQLEAQFASILMEKGESEEVARRLAGETVDFLVNEGRNWAQFQIESPPSSTYKFAVRRNEDGCFLRLYRTVKKKGKWTFDLGSHVERPLPECACN